MEQKKNRIGFLLSYKFFLSFFLTVLDELNKYPNEFEIKITSNLEELRKWDPTVVFLASAYGAKELKKPIKIQLPHGFINSKNTYYNKNHAANDWIVVSSESEKQTFLRHGTKPQKGFLVIGNTQTDLMFRQPKINLKDIDLNENQKTILYAPTFTVGLTSIDLFGKNLINILRANHKNINIIIKAHPAINDSDEIIKKKFPDKLSIFKQWRERFKKFSHLPNVHYVTNHDIDICDYMKISDVLIGDVSAVNFLWLILNKPMILVNNPKIWWMKIKNICGLSSYYDPTGPEWVYRNLMSHHTYNTKKIPILLDEVLTTDKKKNLRTQLHKKLFGEKIDGNTGKRMVELLKKPEFYNK